MWEATPLMRWYRTVLRWLRIDRDVPLVEQRRAMVDAAVVIRGESRHPELRRLFYGPTCKWPREE